MKTELNIHPTKNKWTALILSALVPGVGQLYNGQRRKGIIYIIIAFVVYGFPVLIRVQDSIVWMLAMVVPSVVWRFFAARDAYKTAIKPNTEDRKPTTKLIRYIMIIFLFLGFAVPSAFFPVFNIGIYEIPSSGNSPTIYPGDICIADFNYYKWNKPDYGHLTIFSYNKQHWFFRVVGLPGDKLQLKNGFLFINGDSCSSTHISDTTITEEYYTTTPFTHKKQKWSQAYNYSMYKEVLPNGHAHLIFCNRSDTLYQDKVLDYNVPADHYFLLGDNRSGSMDSRYIGVVPGDQIKARMTRILITGKGDEFNIDLTEK